MLQFIIGLIVGGILGLIIGGVVGLGICTICVVAKDEERDEIFISKEKGNRNARE